jgi:hypothetical protein
MSATFLLSPPDQLGYMEDEVFQVGIATYLGQPCPLMAPAPGCYFGKYREQLNQYGTNLAAASLPGHDIIAYTTIMNHPGCDEVRGDTFRCQGGQFLGMVQSESQKYVSPTSSFTSARHVNTSIKWGDLF